MNTRSLRKLNILKFPDNGYKKVKSFRGNNGVSEQLLDELLETTGTPAWKQLSPFLLKKLMWQSGSG